MSELDIKSEGIKRRKRPTREEKYQTERNEIIISLNEILDLKNKKSIIMSELKKREDIKEKIRELVPSIKKFYKTCSLGYFSKESKKGMQLVAQNL